MKNPNQKPLSFFDQQQIALSEQSAIKGGEDFIGNEDMVQG